MSVYINIKNAEYRKNMAGFDFDWTLINPLDNKTFPTSINDWEWYHPNIPKILTGLYEKNYMIVIFTNQSKKWKHEQIKNVMTTLNIPCHIVIATKKDIYKPNVELFNEFINDKSINKENSFYVGDALGRKIDFSDSDLLFAQNVGIKCYSPEEYFNIKFNITEETIKGIKKINNLNNDDKKLIIMIGYPGSGKSTIANYILNNYKNFEIVSGDKLKTESKMKKAMTKYLNDNKSIIIDATNGNKKKRNIYINLGLKLGLDKNNIILIETSKNLNEAYKMNRTRNADLQIPRIAYNVYRKYYEQPDNNIEIFGSYYLLK
jgi:bifunctional polynucleotide phosphatase/kinase